MQVENLDKRFAELRSSEWNHVREEVKHYAKWYCPKSSAYCFHEHAFARKHRIKRKDISRKTKRSKKRAKTLPIAPACWPDASIMQPRQSARQDSANSWEIVSPADPLMCENP